jgi:hypothetical protein
MPRTPRVAALAAAFVTAAAGAGFAAAPPDLVPPFGPRFGQNSYTTKIQGDGGVPDVDDYVEDLQRGETLSVSVTAIRHSHLLPQIELIGPDGADAKPKLKTSKSGDSVQFKGFAIAVSGRWTVRVTGAGSTEGDYSIAFSVKPAAPTTFRHQHLGDDMPLFKVNKFAGLDGALLNFKLTWSSKELPVDLKSMTDPNGREVLAPDGKKAFEEVRTDAKRRTLTFSALPLHVGDGDYAIRVKTPQGSATYDVTFDVVPQGRPHGRRPVALSATEPFLDPAPDPIRGRPDFTLRLHGRNFSASPAPTVWFGSAAGSTSAVAPDGTYVDVIVPQGVPGTTVPVAVVNADGQAAVRGSYFTYLQPIKLTDLVDDAGVPVRFGTTRGGRALHLLGAFFETGQVVRFGTAVAQVTGVVSAGEMTIVTPATQAGAVDVTITDVFGGVATSDFKFTFKRPPTFDAAPYSPSVSAVQTAVTITIHGHDFEAADQLSFNGVPVDSVLLGPTTRRFSTPALPAGSYAVTLTDSIGSVERGPDFTVKPPPAISAVTIVAGPHVGTTGIPALGGTTIRVDGTDFHETDVVTLGGAAVTFTSHSKTSFTFDAPPGSFGAAALSVTDGANQSATAANALRYVGYSDATTSRSPGASAADSLLANRGAVGDLDNDGVADDLVLVTSYYYIGTRTEMTRVFLGNGSGALVDKTSTNFPAAGSDSSGADNWNASAVAIGDVDGAHGADIIIAGTAPYGAGGSVYKNIRLFKNDGAGKFTQDEADAPPSAYTPGVVAVDPTGAYFVVYGTVFEAGNTTAMAIGDLDKDGHPDLVVARDRYELHYIGIDPTKVNFATTPPSVTTANISYLSYFQYVSATKIFENDFAHSNGFVDKTTAKMPRIGDSNSSPVPCFQARDVALGDIDKDGDLDIVETWDDPTTVTAFGTYSGSGVDTPRVSTRVLLNNGSGKFTDATSSLMPAGSSPEFWQAKRLALADLDKDGDLDLVLLHDVGTDAFNTKPPTFSKTALRVLRNDGPGHGFVDVTATAIPALPGNGDNFRGVALAVRDVDGDGWPDILVGTTESLTDAAGNPVHATRLFRGGPGLKFTLDNAFLTSEQSDSGEVNDILLGDLAGTTDPSLILVTVATPQHSVNGQALRVLDWHR